MLTVGTILSSLTYAFSDHLLLRYFYMSETTHSSKSALSDTQVPYSRLASCLPTYVMTDFASLLTTADRFVSPPQETSLAPHPHLHLPGPVRRRPSHPHHRIQRPAVLPPSHEPRPRRGWRGSLHLWRAPLVRCSDWDLHDIDSTALRGYPKD